MVPGWSSTEIVQMVFIGYIRRSRGQKNSFSKCNFQKSSCLKLQGPELSYLVNSIIYKSSTKVVQNKPLWSKLTLAQDLLFHIELYKENLKRHFMGI